MKAKNKRNYLKERGITLIALVVTIVVLLILAGVTINAVFSDSGIIKKAQDAQNISNESVQKDMEQINALENWMNENTGEGNKVNIKIRIGHVGVANENGYLKIYDGKDNNGKLLFEKTRDFTSDLNIGTFTFNSGYIYIDAKGKYKVYCGADPESCVKEELTYAAPYFFEIISSGDFNLWLDYDF